jgi:citrate lyase subunit beta/citryl-CoA lyase
MTIRPRRSVLFMPGSNTRAVEKAKTLPVDGVILDLEDSIAPNEKDAARGQLVKSAKAGGFGKRELFIRTNAIDTPWFADDFSAAAHAGCDAVVVPKVSTPQQIEMLGQRLLDMHAPTPMRLWIMIETPLAIFNAPMLAATARDSETRLAGFIVGTNDLSKETRARIVPGRAPMLSWLSNCVLAAHAYNVDILDSVYNDIANTNGFAEECAQGRDLGFDGKTLIHPSQIDACNAAFSPPVEEVAQARKVIAAFALPENAGKGVIQLDGRMVEKMHADIAQRTVAIADAIAAKG